MTTATWSSRVRQDTDATYQEWRDEFITKLGVLVAGGKLAADETNITPGVGGRTINTEQGYAVYHLSDSLHSTAPIYIRLGFGAGGATNLPRVQVTVGTSTNGSGVLGGTCLSTIVNFNGGTAPQTTDTARNSYFCAVDGFLGLHWKVGASTTEAFLAVMRSVDAAGANTATAGLLVASAGTSGNLNKTQAFRYASTAAAFTARTSAVDTALGFNPQVPSSVLVGTDVQIFVGWIPTPAVAPVVGVCGLLSADVNQGSSFSATLVGSTSRTYLALSDAAGPFGPGGVATGYPKFAMLWE